MTDLQLLVNIKAKLFDIEAQNKVINALYDALEKLYLERAKKLKEIKDINDSRFGLRACLESRLSGCSSIG
jgi:hypothetical protein